MPVILEDARSLGNGYECRVRLPDGSLEETVISAEEPVALVEKEELEAAQKAVQRIKKVVRNVVEKGEVHE